MPLFFLPASRYNRGRRQVIIVEILVGKEGAIGRLDGQRSDDDRGLLAIGIGLLIILLLACCGASDRISLPVARNTGVVSGRLIRLDEPDRRDGIGGDDVTGTGRRDPERSADCRRNYSDGDPSGS